MTLREWWQRRKVRRAAVQALPEIVARITELTRALRNTQGGLQAHTDVFLDYGARLAAIETLLKHARRTNGASLARLTTLAYQDLRARWEAGRTKPEGETAPPRVEAPEPVEPPVTTDPAADRAVGDQA